MTFPVAGTAIFLSALSLSAVAPASEAVGASVRFDAVVPGEPAQV